MYFYSFTIYWLNALREHYDLKVPRNNSVFFSFRRNWKTGPFRCFLWCARWCSVNEINCIKAASHIYLLLLHITKFDYLLNVLAKKFLFFSGNFMPSNGVLYMVLNQLMNVWIIGTTKVETLRSKVSREVHHWATILRLFNNYLILSQWIIGYNAIDLNLEGSAVVYKLFSKWHLVFGQQQKWLVVVLSWN